MMINKAYYEGGVRVMLGGVPCRLACKPTPTMLAMMRETARGFCARGRAALTEKEQAACQAAYDRMPKLGSRSIADILPSRETAK